MYTWKRVLGRKTIHVLTFYPKTQIFSLEVIEADHLHDDKTNTDEYSDPRSKETFDAGCVAQIIPVCATSKNGGVASYFTITTNPANIDALKLAMIDRELEQIAIDKAEAIKHKNTCTAQAKSLESFRRRFVTGGKLNE